MASLVERVLPMLSQSVAISSKLSSFQTSDVGSRSVQNPPSSVSFPTFSLPPPLSEAKRQGEGEGSAEASQAFVSFEERSV
ncbi:hypothetical protein Pint_06467 [Pistacia integerrima]|uniref:Uncharacterized protein n=2 Tax=Pistacia integerrima TaxID=434235 RepID=A0ACC0Z6Q4_9ROSI|nr:hypothetical protein Pint_06470 [Pistacia integerrima]KAJ0046494.1 hypothetical protein Pint_06467 [Pistacia integerrima]